jgi:aminopeptidase N
MKEPTPQVVYLKEYKAPDFKVETIKLTFELDDHKTKVTSVMEIVRLNPSASELFLNGEELLLESIKFNQTSLTTKDYQLEKEGLRLFKVDPKFKLEIINFIDPANNTALDGLYKSGNIFCTQNEPEGFRRITYSIDRPDNMAKFTTKIIADARKYPVLLSNGNPVDQGNLPGGLHFMEWEDPFPKPSYLFALVAGKMDLLRDCFITRSGREIDLRVYCDPGNLDKCHHAMDSLKNAMKWDEERFGLEYDLDIYMIVAVDAFNMGAMENKGLNIFNSIYVLAKTETATDANFLGIEAVVGHEYFHNWTGNRITCRDWFQLTLKEGLTVFRDQEFSSDLNSRAVHRIADVQRLRASQFPEDAGPTAHPIRPESYMEINNFYTATIYEKGAEVIRMILTFLGRDGFRRGMDKYFELYDGKAVTTDDFLHAMSVGNNNFDFTQFKNWYRQAGTPDVLVNTAFDSNSKEFKLKISQTCRATAESKDKKPFHFPLSIGLLDSKGNEIPLKIKGTVGATTDLSRGILGIQKGEEEFIFTGVNEKPVLSINRDFSAPVNVHYDYSNKELAFLKSHDRDLYNRYDAAQRLGQIVVADLIADHASEAREVYKEAFGKLLRDSSVDQQFKTLVLAPVNPQDLLLEQKELKVEKTFKSRDQLSLEIARTYKNEIEECYFQNIDKGRYKLDPVSVGKRSLKNLMLHYLLLGNPARGTELALAQFRQSGNMTEVMGALAQLVCFSPDQAELVSREFYQKWKGDTLVMQKLIALWSSVEDDRVFAKLKEWESDPVYNPKVPNLFRSLTASFSRNLRQFHHGSGKGFSYLAEKILEIDSVNPQMAAALAKGFKFYGKLPADLKAHATVSLQQVIKKENLSKNTYEIVSKTLA